LRLAGAVWLFWYVRGHFARGREALARALALPGAQARTPARAQALFAAGGLALYQGDFVEGHRLSQAALELYRSLGDRLGVARSLSHVALCESGEGRYAEASARYPEAIAIFREAGDARRLSAALNNLGMLKRQQGDFQTALAHHEEALGLLRQTVDRDGMVATLVNVGLACVRLGRADEAGCSVDEALAHARDLRAKRAGAAALEVAADVMLAGARAEEGARLVGAARALRSSIGLSGGDPWWRRMQEELAERLRKTLGDERFERLTEAGAEMSFEQAVEDARRFLTPEPAREGMP
jgi:tetratricopeptide (TPR) repeat protein